MYIYRERERERREEKDIENDLKIIPVFPDYRTFSSYKLKQNKARYS